MVLSIAVLMPPVVGGVLYSVRDGFSQAVAAVVFALTVTVVAMTGNRMAGLVSAVGSAVWFDYFFTQPYLSFTINDRDDVELALVLIAVGAVVTELAARAQRATRRCRPPSRLPGGNPRTGERG